MAGLQGAIATPSNDKRATNLLRGRSFPCGRAPRMLAIRRSSPASVAWPFVGCSAVYHFGSQAQSVGGNHRVHKALFTMPKLL